MTVEIPRDQYGRPKILVNGELVPYTRSSTLAKVLEDRSNLEKWSMRLVALGLAARHDILALVARCDSSDRDALNQLTEQAKAHAGGSSAAQLGTAKHKLLEDYDRGIPIPFLVGNDQATIDTWVQFQREFGFDIEPAHIECFGVCDEIEVAGTTDRLVRYHRYPDKLTVLDIKTGSDSSANYAGLSWGVQLACYAHSLAYSWDGTTAVRTQLPIGTDVALVAHIPADGGKPALYEVDIESGWQWALLAQQVHTARKVAKKSAIRHAERAVAKGKTTEEIQQDIDAFAGLNNPTPEKGTGIESTYEPKFTMVTVPKEDPATLAPVVSIKTGKPLSAGETVKETLQRLNADTEWEQTKRTREWVQRRVDDVKNYPDALADLVAWWPKDIPTLKQSDNHTLGQLIQIGHIIDDVRAKHALPWAPEDAEDPVAPPKEPKHNVILDGPIPVAQPYRRDDPDECGPADPDMVTGLNKRFKQLKDESKAKFNMWREEANLANCGFKLSEDPTKRKAAIMRAMLQWAEVNPEFGTENDVAWVAIRSVLYADEDDLDIMQNTGVLFTQLTKRQADAVGDLGMVFDAGEIALHSDGQTMWFEGETLAAILDRYFGEVLE